MRVRPPPSSLQKNEMKKAKTLWSNRESKWKPRNFQAAKATFAAKGLHLPPPEPPVNVLEQRRLEAEERKKRAEQAQKDLEAHAAAEEEKKRILKEKNKEAKIIKAKEAKPSAKWLAKYFRNMAKTRGGVPLSKEEQAKLKEAYLQGRLRI